MRRPTTIVHCDGSCPVDPTFDHRFYFGCVPVDFSQRTGRSRSRHQHPVKGLPGITYSRYLWNGGCDQGMLFVLRLAGWAGRS